MRRRERGGRGRSIRESKQEKGKEEEQRKDEEKGCDEEE